MTAPLDPGASSPARGGPAALGLLVLGVVVAVLVGSVALFSVDALIAEPYVRNADWRHAMRCASQKAPRPDDCVITLRGDGGQTMIAPTLHAFVRHRSARWYRWIDDNPEQALPDALPGDPPLIT